MHIAINVETVVTLQSGALFIFAVWRLKNCDLISLNRRVAQWLERPPRSR